MSEPLEVRRIELAPLAAADAGPGGERWFSLEVTVGNASASRLHVVSELRRIEYDPGARVLRVSFAETAERADVAGVPIPASTVAVAAGEEATLSARIPAVITSARSTEGGGLERIEIGLEGDDVRALECTVAYGGEEPAPFNLTEVDHGPRTAGWALASGSIELP